MYIDTNSVFSMTQANRNFSLIARTADKKGEAVVLKNNKPKYLIIDIENSNYNLELTEDEKVEIAAKRILDRFRPAFEELAK